MEALEAILTRRSVRKFKSQPVDQTIVKQLLTAAMSAPSAMNSQPWHFVVIDKRELLNKIPEFHPYSSMCREAPLAIVVCADLSLEKSEGFWIQDLAAATQNILLAARALGLGAVWLSGYPAEERVAGIKKLFQLPKNFMPLSIVPIGYTDVPQVAQPRFDQKRVHYNSF